MTVRPGSASEFVVSPPPAPRSAGNLSIPATPLSGASASFGNLTTASALPSARSNSSFASTSKDAKAVTPLAGINFAIESLTEVSRVVRQCKREALSRLQQIARQRLAIELELIRDRMIVKEGGYPPIWTPFGDVDLPFVKTFDKNVPRYDPTAALAMCLGAENEIKKEVQSFEVVLREIDEQILFFKK